MLFEDQIEQLKELSQIIKEKAQESSLYVTVYERYTSLSPSMQKFCIIAIVFMISLLVLSAPIAKFKTSAENLESFQSQKNITQSIIQKARQSQASIKTPKQFTQQELQSTLDSYNKSPLISILKEQSSISTNNSSNPSIRGAESKVFNITNKNVNAEQSLTQTYSFKKLNKSLLVKELRFEASKDRPGYFTHNLELENLYLKPISGILPTNTGVGRPNNNRRSLRR